MKLLSTNFWLKVSASVSPSANGISSLLVAPRMCIYQCILTSRNLQSTSSSHNNNNNTNQTQKTNFKETKLKVMFFGTDDFALETLKKLHTREKLNVIRDLEVCCISNSGTSVYKYAVKNGIKTHLYPPQIDTGQFDLGVVASFGKLISSSVISKFSRGMINVHGSLLPKLRGAAPIVHAIKQGMSETGVTIMKIKPKKFDVGEMLAQERIPIGPDMTRKVLTNQMATVGSELLCDVLEDLDKYEAAAIIQDNSEATLAPAINKSIAAIDFNTQSASDIYNLWRSIEDLMKLRCRWKPTNTSIRFGCVYSPERILHLQQKLASEYPNSEPGCAVWMKYGKQGNFLCIKCCEGWIAIDKIIYGTKKTMSANDFANGFMKNNSQTESMFIKDETKL